MKKDLNLVIKAGMKCMLKKGVLCTNYCRDCRFMEMDNNEWNDGTRRCSYKGEWLRPSTPACSRFEP